MKWGIMCLATFGESHPEWVKSNGEIRAFDNINAAHLYAGLQNQTWKWSYYQVEELPKRSLPTASTPRHSTGYGNNTTYNKEKRHE